MNSRIISRYRHITTEMCNRLHILLNYAVDWIMSGMLVCRILHVGRNSPIEGFTVLATLRMSWSEIAFCPNRPTRGAGVMEADGRTTTLKEGLELLSWLDFFGCARRIEHSGKVSSELAQERQTWSASVICKTWLSILGIPVQPAKVVRRHMYKKARTGRLLGSHINVEKQNYRFGIQTDEHHRWLQLIFACKKMNRLRT